MRGTALSDTRTYTPWLLSACLLIAGAVLLYPSCQYYIDPDGTAYLTIAQRYAAGDYMKAVNGYWSPWACWLTALGIKSGLAAIPASIVVNTTGGLGLLWISQSLFRLFGMKQGLRTIMGTTLALFLCYAVYKQSFGDLWECFFLLVSLRIMLYDDYIARPGLWVLNGVAGALAYFSKAYAFPFFILNTLCCGFYITSAWERHGRILWLRLSITSVVVMLVCSSPWLYLLHEKYGIWITSTAGRLNTSWYLVGHPCWKDTVHALLPPVYSNSPYYWEDPYMVNGITPHFWNNPKLFALQIARAGLNLLKLVQAMNEISAFFLLVWLIALGILVSERVRYVLGRKTLVPALSFLLFPLGFLIINYEARYLWYMLPLSMLIGGLALQRVVARAAGNRILLFIIPLVFAGSYLVWPLYDLKNIAGQGRAEYETAAKMKEMGIQGSFTTALPHGPYTQKLARLAYFSGNAYYMMPGATTTKAELLKDMRKYHVKYYLQYETGMDKAPFADENGKPFPEVTGGRLLNIKLYDIGL